MSEGRGVFGFGLLKRTEKKETPPVQSDDTQIVQRLDVLIDEMKGMRTAMDSLAKRDKITSGLIFGLEGITDSSRSTVTFQQKRNFPFTAPIASIWILNDGPSDVLVALNKSAFGDAPMRRGELMTFQTPENKIKSVHFICPNATAAGAAIRFWTMR